VVLYPLALTLFLGGFVVALGTRPAADVTLLRSQVEPFRIEADGRVANQIRIRIGNRSRAEHRYAITILGADSGTVIAPESPLLVKAGALRTTSVFVLLPKAAFTNGQRDVTIRISAGESFQEDFPFNLLGPVAGPPEAP
jgi:polyferredoxin